MNTSRRTFLKSTTLAIGSLALPPMTMASSERSNIDSFGFQSWTIRESLNAQPEKTCAMMSDFGYREIEMCSPLGYKNAGFEPLGKFSGKQLKEIFEDNGLTCTSSHFNFGELKDSLDDRIEWAHDIGMKQMILSSFWLPKEEQTLDHYRRVCGELNVIAEKTKAAGLQMGFHNHHMEFEMRVDTLIYDVLLNELDPDLVKMQFQVAVVNIGYNASDYFRKYPGRFISAHLSDWSKEKDTQVPIGQGEVDWKEFFLAAETGGLKNIYVEMDPSTFKPSAEYLKSL